MFRVEKFLNTDEVGPIDIVEILAKHHDWDFDRLTEDQIAIKTRQNNPIDIFSIYFILF